MKCLTGIDHKCKRLLTQIDETCEPAILPPLSEIYQGNMAADLFGVRAVAEKNIEDTCSLSINRIKSDKSRRVNRSSLADLFLSFLEKFCDINMRALTQWISPYNGHGKILIQIHQWNVSTQHTLQRNTPQR